jgi:hypothetical protein
MNPRLIRSRHEKVSMHWDHVEVTWHVHSSFPPVETPAFTHGEETGAPFSLYDLNRQNLLYMRYFLHGQNDYLAYPTE